MGSGPYDQLTAKEDICIRYAAGLCDVLNPSAGRRMDELSMAIFNLQAWASNVVRLAEVHREQLRKQKKGDK